MSEKKSLTEILITPLVIAIVGAISTFFIVEQQEISAEKRHNSNRQVKILEIFANKITSPKESDRVLALRLLRILEPDIAQQIAEAVAEGASEGSTERKVANKEAVVAKAKAELIPRIYIYVKVKEQNISAKQLEKALEKNSWVVPAIQMKSAHSPNLSDFRYFKKSEKKTAEIIYSVIKKTYPNVRLRYLERFENSTNIRANHFELWLGDNSK